MGLSLRHLGRVGALSCALALPVFALPALADPIRVASYAPGLSRKGPGLLLRDIQRGEDDQIAAVIKVIAAAEADILLLTGIDWDYDARALSALAERLAEAGAAYPHRFTAQPNRGRDSGTDLDGDGREGMPEDAQGFGFFTGQNGMAVLSRLPLRLIADHSAALWRDQPGQIIGDALTPQAQAVQRLSTTNHWHLAADWGGAPLHLLAFSATTPVFDGPEDRNGRRNHDEITFWARNLPDAPFVLLGNANLDPVDGEGRHEAISALLRHPRITDPQPRSRGAAQAPQTGANAAQQGDPALDTADWAEADGPGNLRVDYVLPSRDLSVQEAGVIWPADDEAPHDTAITASRHRLVWVDIARGPGKAAPAQDP